MSRTFLALAALSVAATLAPSAAHAQIYPWCAIYGGRGGGGTNCGFSTLAQCRATVSGTGGTCEPNAAYPPKASRRKVKQY